MIFFKFGGKEHQVNKKIETADSNEGETRDCALP